MKRKQTQVRAYTETKDALKRIAAILGMTQPEVLEMVTLEKLERMDQDGTLNAWAQEQLRHLPR